MGWVLRLVETEMDGPPRWIDVMEISRFRDVDDIANLGLSLAEGKLLLARVQHAGLDEVLICCCKFDVRSTTARWDTDSASVSTPRPAPMRH